MILKRTFALFAFLFAFVLLIGGRNLGMGVHVTPLPWAGLACTALGLGVWCALSRVIMRLPWFRTFLVASYIAFAIFAVEGFVAAYVSFARLQDTALGEPVDGLGSTMIFNVGSGLLSLVSIFVLYLSARAGRGRATMD